MRLTGEQEGAAQLPPWELAAQTPIKAVPRWVPSVPVPKPVPVAPPEPEKPLEILTPDLPAPPPERANAAPVGDETVIELVEDDAADSLELEPENTNHGYDEEIPLEVRKTRRAALPRVQLSPTCAAPPVEDVSETLPTRYYILSEEGTEPPTKEEEESGYEIIVLRCTPPTRPAAARVSSDSSPVVEPAIGGQNRMVGMLVVFVLALLLAGYFLLGRSSEPSTVKTDATPAAPVSTPASTPVAAPTAVPVAITPVAAQEPVTLPATPVPVVVTPTPVPAPAPTVALVRTPAPVAPKVEAPKVEAPKPTPTPKPVAAKPVEPAARPTPKPTPPPAEKPVAQEPAVEASPIRVLVVSNQIGADVQVNGAPRGRVPATVMLPPGTYQIKVIPKDLPEQSRSVEVKSDGTSSAQKVVFTF